MQRLDAVIYSKADITFRVPIKIKIIYSRIVNVSSQMLQQQVYIDIHVFAIEKKEKNIQLLAHAQC